MIQRTCVVDGCHKPHRARGLCSTHYNQQHQPNRHPRADVTCAVCGSRVNRYVSNRYRPTCSVACRAVVAGLANRQPYDWATDAMTRARCAGATIVELIDRDAVFDRDEWTCYLCGVTVHQPSPFDPVAATVDHVLPLSRGGQHTMDNVRCACLSCNSRKQADLLVA